MPASKIDHIDALMGYPVREQFRNGMVVGFTMTAIDHHGDDSSTLDAGDAIHGINHITDIDESFRDGAVKVVDEFLNAIEHRELELETILSLKGVFDGSELQYIDTNQRIDDLEILARTVGGDLFLHVVGSGLTFEDTSHYPEAVAELFGDVCDETFFHVETDIINTDLSDSYIGVSLKRDRQ